MVPLNYSSPGVVNKYYSNCELLSSDCGFPEGDVETVPKPSVGSAGGNTKVDADVHCGTRLGTCRKTY